MKKTLIIAEAGANHNGDIKIAKKLIIEAKKAGADVVKFQTSIPTEHISKYAKIANYQGKNNAKSQLELCKDITLPLKDFKILKTFCKNKSINFLSTPFDLPSVKILKSLGCKQFKISSGDIDNFLLLKAVSHKDHKIILSTGMCTISDIENNIRFLKKNGIKKKNLSILHCNTEYPSPFADLNLGAIEILKKKFNLEVGYSDHSLGIEAPIAAVAIGAKIIEKHFTLSRKMKGPDHKASLEPDELKYMIKCIRNIEKSLNKKKCITKSEKKNKLIVRKSIVAKKNIKKNEIFTINNITVKRPAGGINPKYFFKYLGKKSKKKFKIDEKIS